LPEVRARIVSVAHHDSGVRLISLALPVPFPFHAGQYLNVVHPGGVRIPMSIASAPERVPELELHYRPLPGVAEAQLMNELLDAGTELSIEGPFGDVRITAPLTEDLLLIAGGSGISQCLAILEHLRRAEHARSVTLVWSVTQREHLYADAELRNFATWLNYEAVVDSPQATSAVLTWLRTHALPTSGRIIISGGPGFVHAVADTLSALGATNATIESDVFSYAPR
jgi:CDP-4-dehydro-6-deoxyglucose reductase, E3